MCMLYLMSLIDFLKGCFLFSDTFLPSFLGLWAPLLPKGPLLGILRKSCDIPGSNLEHLGTSLGGLWGQFGSYVGL